MVSFIAIKISSRTTLIQLLSDIFDFDTCIRCFSKVGNILAFIYPRKEPIWNTHFGSPFSASTLSQTLLYFQLSSHKQQYGPPASVFFSHYVFTSVWRHYWPMVFDNQLLCYVKIFCDSHAVPVSLFK